MALTNAEKQARWRARRKAELAALLKALDDQDDRIAELEAEVKRLKSSSNRPIPRRNVDWQGRPLYQRISDD